MQAQITAPDKLEEDIISEFHNKLDGIPLWKKEKNEGWTDKRWTKEVKDAVGRAAKKRGHKIRASRCDQADGGEWLYDLICLEYEDEYLKGIPLVLESEWKGRYSKKNYEGEILKDFRKLLVSRAGLRVMVLEAKSEEKGKEVVERLLQHVQNCRCSTAGDRYLFACCRQIEKKWAFDCSVYVVKE